MDGKMSHLPTSYPCPKCKIDVEPRLDKQIATVMEEKAGVLSVLRCPKCDDILMLDFRPDALTH